MSFNALGSVYSKVLATNKAFIEEHLLDLNYVLEILYNNNALSKEQCEVIISGESDSDRTCRLIDILMRLHSPSEVFEAFCKALKSANYENIYVKLLSDYERYGTPANSNDIDCRTERSMYINNINRV